MRLLKQINETMNNLPLDPKHWDTLKKDCKPFLKDVKKRITKTNHFLFRGMSNAPGNVFFKKNVRQDRKPLDSSKAWHKDLGAAFERKFGIDARSKGVFCHARVSFQYGRPFLVFPMNAYYCMWSDYVEDATYEEPDGIYDYGGEGVQKAVDRHADKLLSSYSKGSVDKAIKGVEESRSYLRTEITLICKHYYAVGLEYQVSLEKYIRDEI